MHGMITALDDVVGNVTQKLKDVGIYENTIIGFYNIFFHSFVNLATDPPSKIL